MTTTVVSLSPAEGLLARQISYWIDVSAAGKGGSKDNLGRGWTYLSADDLQGRVAAYDSVELSIPTIYRALRSLVKKGWFIREKLTAHRWFQVFHYTYGANHPSNSKSNGSDQSDQLEQIKADSSQLRDLPDSSTSKSIRQKTDVKTANSQGSPLAHEQPNSLNKEKCAFVPAPTAQPLQAIEGSAPTELIEQLQEIEATYKKRLEALQEPVVESDSGSNEQEQTVGSNPTLSAQEHSTVGASSVMVTEAGVESKKEAETASGSHSKTGRAPAWHAGGQWLEQNPVTKGKHRSAWDRIRALANQFDASALESVSPKKLITMSGQKLRVDDGITSPLR